MNSLTHIDKQKLERELGMDGGHVLDFSNRTFDEFFREVVGVAIYDQRYALGSGSKANRSRGLLVSNSGFAEDGLHAFGRGKRVVCMDGFDMSEMLRRRLSFVAVIDAKVRRAAETGHPFASVRELFP